MKLKGHGVCLACRQFLFVVLVIYRYLLFQIQKLFLSPFVDFTFHVITFEQISGLVWGLRVEGPFSIRKPAPLAAHVGGGAGLWLNQLPSKNEEAQWLGCQHMGSPVGYAQATTLHFASPFKTSELMIGREGYIIGE